MKKSLSIAISLFAVIWIVETTRAQSQKQESKNTETAKESKEVTKSSRIPIIRRSAGKNVPSTKDSTAQKSQQTTEKPKQSGNPTSPTGNLKANSAASKVSAVKASTDAVSQDNSSEETSTTSIPSSAKSSTTATNPTSSDSTPAGRSQPIPRSPQIPALPGGPVNEPSSTSTSAGSTPTIPGGRTTTIPGDASSANGGGNVLANMSNQELDSLENELLQNDEQMLTAKNMPLEQVFEIYQELSGKTILHPVSLEGEITINSQSTLSREEAIQALDYVLALNGITMVKGDSDKFITAVVTAEALLEPQSFSDLSTADLPETGGLITRVVTVNYLVPSELVESLAPFSKLDGGLTPYDQTNLLVIKDYAGNVKRMMEIIDRIDVEVEKEIEMELIPIRYALASDIAEIIGSLTIGGTALTVGGSRGNSGGGSSLGRGSNRGNSRTNSGSGGNSRNSYGSSSSGYGGSSYGGGSYRGFANSLPRELEELEAQGFNIRNVEYNMDSIRPFQSSRTRPTTTSSRSKSSASRTGIRTPASSSASSSASRGSRSAFRSNVNNIVRQAGGGLEEELQILENATIIADLNSNSILVFSNKRDLILIKDIISELDKVQPQVLIESLIIEVSLGDTLDYGVSASQNKKTAGDFTGAGIINNLSAGEPFLDPSTLLSFSDFTDGGVGSGFSYFGTFGDDWDFLVRAVATDSRIHVLAKPRAQTTHAKSASLFVGETVPFVSGSGIGFSGTSQSFTQQLDVGISMYVEPLINPEGLVVMYMDLVVENRGEDVIIDGNPVPATTRREAQAEVAVRDGEIIILGGFINQIKRSSASGVPLLKDIPWLGKLFSRTRTSSEEIELIILIHPTVLETPELAAIHAENEKRTNLPGIQEAEREFQEAKKKQWNRIEAKKRKASGKRGKRELFLN
ncbi:MAG TPA: hypothetical protein EYQ50_05425 [Verrucomicrobiales bacterium]|nr:hypothetical protein [Verrucomicrobiales bacterium]HIL71415.1 hypothetical protein [Verrucomicrobiota bacterium]